MCPLLLEHLTCNDDNDIFLFIMNLRFMNDQQHRVEAHIQNTELLKEGLFYDETSVITGTSKSWL